MNPTFAPLDPYADDEVRVMPEPLLTIGNWRLVPGKEFGELTAQQKALADLFVELFPAAVEAMKALPALPTDHVAYITLGTEEEAYDWEVSDEALGFNAVAARKTDDDNGDDFIVVNEFSEAVINLGAIAHEFSRSPPDTHDVDAALVTLPHEMVHLVEWVTASKGRTPLEVFDSEDGEMGLRNVAAIIEQQAHQRGAEENHRGFAEDEAESLGRDLLDRWSNTTATGIEKTQAVIDAFERRPAPRPR